jgi:hypothetical protein
MRTSHAYRFDRQAHGAGHERSDSQIQLSAMHTPKITVTTNQYTVGRHVSQV